MENKKIIISDRLPTEEESNKILKVFIDCMETELGKEFKIELEDGRFRVFRRVA